MIQVMMIRMKIHPNQNEDVFRCSSQNWCGIGSGPLMGVPIQLYIIYGPKMGLVAQAQVHP